MGLIDKAKDVAADAADKATRARRAAIDKTKDVASDAVGQGHPGRRPGHRQDQGCRRVTSSARPARPPGPAWDKTKDVAGEVIVKAVGVAGPALEKTRAAAETAGHVVAGTVAELKGQGVPGETQRLTGPAPG